MPSKVLDKLPTICTLKTVNRCYDYSGSSHQDSREEKTSASSAVSAFEMFRMAQAA